MRASSTHLLAVLLLGLLPGLVANAQTNAPVAEVPRVDPAQIKVSDFTDEELDLPYYLFNFHRVANSVPLEGELRGWITASVWRGNANQRTYNARVLESHLSLAYFYCTKRPWNPYHGSPAVRARLEAMLERWCNMQGADGKFTEYSAERYGLAPTAFATKFMAETLRLLESGPPIDRALHERVKQAQRKAIVITLTDADLWEHGRQYANQFSNVFAGGLAWLALCPDDAEVRGLLRERMQEAALELQSPAGYFYERGGVDWGYNLSTHHSNLHIAWHYARGTEFEPFVLEETRRFYDWMGWNAVMEPDGLGFVLNRAIETRQRRPWISATDGPQGRNYSSLPQAEVIEPARAFTSSREQEAAAHARQRAELEKNWPHHPGMRDGDFRAFTPYAFLHRSMVDWRPTSKERAEAQRKLPTVQRDGRLHVRADGRRAVHFVYVRQPKYYAAFNGGEKIEDPQRYGPGLLWAPGVGALVQSQTGSDEDAWATRVPGTNAPYEAGDIKTQIQAGGKSITPAPGALDVNTADVTLRYALGDAGHKTIDFNEDRIQIQTRHPGAFYESVPLLARETDRVQAGDRRVTLERGGSTVLAIEFEPDTQVELSEPHGRIGPYRIITARLAAKDKLSYTMRFAPGSEPAR